MGARSLFALIVLVAAGSLSGCAHYRRLGFERRTGERLSVGPDPNRPGKRSGYQGKTPVLDEESFYRIAADVPASGYYGQYRQSANAQRDAGVGLAIAGFVGTPIAPLAFLPVWAFRDPYSYDYGLHVAVTVAITVSLFATGVTGAWLAHDGRKRAVGPPPPIVDDPAYMQRAADEYNRQIDAERAKRKREQPPPEP